MAGIVDEDVARKLTPAAPLSRELHPADVVVIHLDLDRLTRRARGI